MSETRDTCFRCGGKGVIEATPMSCGVRCWDDCPVCGDKAEISRLQSRIEELERSLTESNGRVIHYQKIAGRQGSKLFRKDILLKTARELGISSRAYDSSVAMAIAEAIDGDTPLAWPSSPFAQKWLTKQGYSDCGGQVGLRLTMNLADGVEVKDGARSVLEAASKGGE